MGEFARQPTRSEEPAAAARRSATPPGARPAVLQAREMAARVTARGTPRDGLPANLKAGLESLSGIALDDVRVHRNSARPGQVQAHAFAQGSDIHLGPGQERHLPHEAWHVVQQRQGRVRTSARLPGGTPINTDLALEREAGTMGDRAQSFAAPADAPATASPPAPPTPPASSEMPLQAVWIMRNGTLVWENDPYVLKSGESYPFGSTPRVLVESGTKEVRFDASGTASTLKRKAPPDHPELQKQREQQGRELRAALLKDPTKIQAAIKELQGLTGELEPLAGKSAPIKHKQKVQTLISGGEVIGDDFRNMVKAQDEFTQSEATASFLKGLRDKGTTPGPHDKALEAYATAALQLMSSLRTPTQSVVAPITYNNQVTGLQHPTSKDQPKLTGGGSGHSFGDRNRVQEQITTFRQAISDTNATPNQVFLISNLSAISATLGTMSAPTSANNLPRFNQPREETQIKERNQIKKQANKLAEALKIPTATDVQDFDAPWVPHETPTSPLRNPSTAPKIKKPPTAPTPLTLPPQANTQQANTQQANTPQSLPPQQTTTTNAPPQQILTNGSAQQTISPPQQTSTSLPPQHQPSVTTPQPSTLGYVPVSLLHQQHALQLQQYVCNVAERLFRMLEPRQDQWDGTRNALQQHVAGIYAGAANADPAHPATLNGLEGLAYVLGTIYRQSTNWLQRQPISQTHAATTAPEGQRIDALEQLFAECGQMAAHNALMIFGQHDLGSQQVTAAVANQQHLNTLGSFEDNINEDQLRQIIAQQNRTDIPVLGNIAQVSTIVDLIGQNDLQGLANLTVSNEEITSLQPIVAFMRNQLQSVVLVLNTEGHKLAKQKTLHWIAVRVTRTQAGLGIEYLDSLYAVADYTATFAALRQLLGRAPLQPPIQLPQVNPPALGPQGFNPGTPSTSDFLSFFLDSPTGGTSSGMDLGSGALGSPLSTSHSAFDDSDFLSDFNPHGSFLAPDLPNPFAFDFSSQTPNASALQTIDWAALFASLEREEDPNPAKRRKFP